MLGEWVGAGIWTVGSPAEFRRFGGLLDAGGRISLFKEPFPSVSESESEPFSPKTKRRSYFNETRPRIKKLWIIHKWTNLAVRAAFQTLERSESPNAAKVSWIFESPEGSPIYE